MIIGGVAAGLAAAMQARRVAPEMEITVLEKTGDISYGACGLPYVISGLIPSFEQLILHTPDYFRERHNIAVRLHSEALEIWPAKSIVRVREKEEVRELSFTGLVIASGAMAVCPPLPGHNLEGVFVLRHLGDGRRLLRYIESVRPRAVAVVGAGYIGLEMAEAFRERGLKTTIVEATDRVMSALEGRLRDRIVEELHAHGVDIIFGEKVVAFEGRAGRVERVITEAGRTVEAQVVSIGVGVRPCAELAHAAGLETGTSGAITTDARQQTSAPDIYAAGDCCEVRHLVSGRRVWHPLGQPAVRQGWVAGTNAAGAGGEARYRGVVGTNVVKVFALEVARTGLALAEAQKEGFDASSVEVETASRASYYPGGAKVLTCLVFDRRGRLLGAQMVGREGIAQRIDVYSAALHANLKVEDIERFDLAYAPPYAPTIDPILRATHKASKG